MFDKYCHTSYNGKCFMDIFHQEEYYETINKGGYWM